MKKLIAILCGAALALTIVVPVAAKTKVWSCTQTTVIDVYAGQDEFDQPVILGPVTIGPTAFASPTNQSGVQILIPGTTTPVVTSGYTITTACH